jgi:hypothetical protein
MYIHHKSHTSRRGGRSLALEEETVHVAQGIMASVSCYEPADVTLCKGAGSSGRTAALLPTDPQSDHVSTYHGRRGGNVTSRAIKPSERIKRQGTVCRENISLLSPPAPQIHLCVRDHVVLHFSREKIRSSRKKQFLTTSQEV